MMAARILIRTSVIALLAAVVAAIAQKLIVGEISVMVTAGVAAAVGAIAGLGFKDPEA